MLWPVDAGTYVHVHCLHVLSVHEMVCAYACSENSHTDSRACALLYACKVGSHDCGKSGTGLWRALGLILQLLSCGGTMLLAYDCTGNVSSSTTWYTLGYIETVRGVRKGDTILQVGVGSGIKCGVNCWQVWALTSRAAHGESRW